MFVIESDEIVVVQLSDVVSILSLVVTFLVAINDLTQRHLMD